MNQPLQKHVEIDEPEAPAPLQISGALDELGGEVVVGAEDIVTFDSMSEEDLLAGIEGLVAPEKSDDY